MLTLRSSLSWFFRLNNNSMALTAVANTSRSEFVKHLKRYSSSNNPVSSLARDSAVRPTFGSSGTSRKPLMLMVLAILAA